MTNRTVTLLATNSAGTTPASVTVTVADPPGSGNVIELVGQNLMSSVDPDPLRTAVYAGNLGLAGILADSGMTYSPHYGPAGALIVRGGGHADWGGNSYLLFDLNPGPDQYKWFLLTQPSTAIQRLVVSGNTVPVGCDMLHGEHSDGSPLAFHSYSSLSAIPGGNKGLVVEFMKNNVCWAGPDCAPWSHAIDLETKQITRFSLNAALQRNDKTGAENVCYDAQRGRLWGHIRGGTAIVSYLDLATKMHVNTGATLTNGGYIPTSARVSVNDLMICATNNYNSNYLIPNPFILFAINLANPAAGQKFLPMVGDLPPDCVYPANGFDWDTAHNCGYLYVGNWGWGTQTTNDNLHVYRISPPGAIGENWLDGRPWTFLKITLPSAFPKQLNGVYSRWRYCSGIGKFALVSNINNKVALWTPPS